LLLTGNADASNCHPNQVDANNDVVEGRKAHGRYSLDGQNDE
jgi:hypothetical protein